MCDGHADISLVIQNILSAKHLPTNRPLPDIIYKS